MVLDNMNGNAAGMDGQGPKNKGGRAWQRFSEGFSRVKGNIGKTVSGIRISKISAVMNREELASRIRDFDVKKIKKNYIWIVLGVLATALILTHSIGKIRQILSRDKEIKETVEFLKTTPVKVYKVKRMDFKDTLPVLGRIEGFKHIDLRFSESGVLENYNFEEGERILEGDIIASLDQRDALLKLRYASMELEKSQALFDIGGVENIALDQKKLEYESARRELEKTNIYAGSDGYLGSKDIHAGSYVTPHDKIGTFVDFREIFAAFDVIEEDSSKVKLGQNVDIFIDAYPGSSYKGRIDMVAPMIKGRTRTQSVKVELSNDNDEFRPGMFARAVINTYEKPDALIIPASSFRKEENKFFVYVVHIQEEEGPQGVDETGKVEVREVSIEYLTHDVAEIGKGLTEGELIIRELHQEYKDEDPVEITEVQETIF
ncbi:MAG: efflux RND transporter periplasmic adaptor subunit [Candidatus Omnitrophota bacterium]